MHYGRQGLVMAVVHWLLLAGTALAAPSPGVEGTISGRVLNRSAAQPVPCSATVVLFVRRDGQTLPVGETLSDAAGRFCFAHLPLCDGFAYVSGANHDGVHYPGPPLVLTAAEPRAEIELAVHDAVAQPNPLVIRRHDILICPEAGALRVTESLLIDNPTSTCYVGQPPAEGGEPVTLKLAIPIDFERTTFGEEFYGRRFVVLGDTVATSIPWPPGRRELKFTYVLPNAQSHRVWQRPLDLPCDAVRVRVQTSRSHEVTCSLPAAPPDDQPELVFASQGQSLPAGYVVCVSIGRLPVVWMNYARWFALAGLGALVTGVGCVVIRHRRREQHAATPQAAAAPAPHAAKRRRPAGRRTSH